MSEVQNFTLPQTYLLLTPESGLGSGGDPNAIRDWIASHGKVKTISRADFKAMNESLVPRKKRGGRK